MSQHERLGATSPAKGLGDPVLRIILQFSDLETPSANSEQSCHSAAIDGPDDLVSDEQPSEESYDASSLDESGEWNEVTNLNQTVPS
jgi:hypothetical protein